MLLKEYIKKLLENKNIKGEINSVEDVVIMLDYLEEGGIWNVQMGNETPIRVLKRIETQNSPHTQGIYIGFSGFRELEHSLLYWSGIELDLSAYNDMQKMAEDVFGWITNFKIIVEIWETLDGFFKQKGFKFLYNRNPYWSKLDFSPRGEEMQILPRDGHILFRLYIYGDDMLRRIDIKSVLPSPKELLDELEKIYNEYEAAARNE